eukprot:scaffold34_cov260-Pinguiococcus_pyrenoidosus.AAC.32
MGGALEAKKTWWRTVAEFCGATLAAGKEMHRLDFCADWIVGLSFLLFTIASKAAKAASMKFGFLSSSSFLLSSSAALARGLCCPSLVSLASPLFP